MKRVTVQQVGDTWIADGPNGEVSRGSQRARVLKEATDWAQANGTENSPVSVEVGRDEVTVTWHSIFAYPPLPDDWSRYSAFGYDVSFYDDGSQLECRKGAQTVHLVVTSDTDAVRTMAFAILHFQMSIRPDATIFHIEPASPYRTPDSLYVIMR